MQFIIGNERQQTCLAMLGHSQLSSRINNHKNPQRTKKEIM
jgi:hypothetical protein